MKIKKYHTKMEEISYAIIVVVWYIVDEKEINSGKTKKVGNN